jgi:heptosyltransferase I
MRACRRVSPSAWRLGNERHGRAIPGSSWWFLILKPSSLGDVVQALPVLRLLKQHYRDSEIHWWIEVRNAPLLKGDPDLAGIFRFDRERWAHPWNWGEIWSSVRELRRHRFDLVIDLQALARSSAIGFLANGGCFVGLHDWRELAPGYYDISVPRPSPNTHAVDWYLEVLRVLKVPVHGNFEWLPERTAIASETDAQWNLTAAPTVALLPGARWENKRWPAEHFAATVRTLRERRPDLRFVVLGGKSDTALASIIVAGAPEIARDLTGRTSLLQTVEVLRRCAAVVTNDTGPMHIAAALGKPVIGLFGPTNPRRTGPYGQVEHALQLTDLPCVPCMKPVCTFHEPIACLRRLTPARVAATVLDRVP